MNRTAKVIACTAGIIAIAAGVGLLLAYNEARKATPIFCG